MIVRSGAPVALLLLGALAGCSKTTPTPSLAESTMSSPSPTAMVTELLKSIETGDTAPIAYINPSRYTQHNLAVADGLAGFGEALSHLPKGSARVQTARVFQDGDFVVAHTDYDFFGPKIGFDIFRFEDGRIVEHWDNLQTTVTDTVSGRSMIDGPTQVQDQERTAANKAHVASFVDAVLLGGDFSRLPEFISTETYLQHNPVIGDGLDGLGAAFKTMGEQGIEMIYTQRHALFGQGNFVLTVCEGTFAGQHTSFYDLFRLQDGKIVEHWDVIETIAPTPEHKHANGKFGF